MRIVDLPEAARRLGELPGPEPRVVVSGNCATPWELLSALVGALERVRLFALNPQRGWPVRPGIVTETPFVGAGVRGEESLDYLPMRLSLVPRLFDLVRPPDAVLVHAAPPRDGKISLGMEVNILPAAVERVRARGGLVVAQLNTSMPYTFGDAEIDCDDVDLAVEVDGPLPEPSPRPPDDAAAAIGERAAAFATDGCTLQFGIGQIPDAVATHLAGRRRMAVWSEMVSDGVLALERAGALDPDQELHASFAFGTADLYSWLDGNRRVRMLRTETVNDPGHISAKPAMLSVNTALQVDLFAQANGVFVGHHVYSGFGGQPDFVVGALHSRGGHALVGLRSWHAKSDSSTIVPALTTPVTSLQHSAIVTEQGCAEIFGHGEGSQAQQIIGRCAHPRAREPLREAARRLGAIHPVRGTAPG